MSTDLVTTPDVDVIQTTSSGVAQFTGPAKQLVRAMLCKEATDLELAFFASYCKRLGLDPFSGHVHLVKRGSGSDKVARPELSIAGKLLVAERSGKYRGRTPYEWCGEDGVWTDIWLKPEPPSAARVGVYRDGAAEPIMGTALWSSYVGTKYGGEVNAMWKQHGPRMIAKCALSLALSEALPAELGGVYTIEEMGQADNGSAPEPLTPGQTTCLLDLHKRAGTDEAVAAVRVQNVTSATYDATVEQLEQRIREQETVNAARDEAACAGCKGAGEIDDTPCGDCAGTGMAA